MTVTVKDESQLIIPSSLRRQAGFKPGDRLEFKAIRGVITIAAKREATDDEYTPEQRRQIEAQLAEGLADLKAGRIYGPFSATDLGRFLRSELKSRAKKTKLAK